MLALLITVLLVATALVSLATIHASVRTALGAVRSIAREFAGLEALPLARRPHSFRAPVRRQSVRPAAYVLRAAA